MGSVQDTLQFSDTISDLDTFSSSTRHKKARETVGHRYVTRVGNNQPRVEANALSLQTGGATFKYEAEHQISW